MPEAQTTTLSSHQWIYSTIQRSRQALETEARGWRKLLLAYWSRWGEDSTGVPLELDEMDEADHPMAGGVNYLFAFLDSLAASVAPTNPKATVKAKRKELKTVAEFRQALINETWRKQILSAKGRKLVVRAGMFGRCYLKQVWDKKRRMPKYRVVRPHNVYFDDKAEEWDDLRYIGEIVPLTRGEFEQRLKSPENPEGKYDISEQARASVVFGAYPGWLSDDGIDSEGETHRANYAQWVLVYEHYDLVAKKFYHFVDGVPTPVFEGALPYALVENPFSMLVFNDNLVNLRGVGDAGLIYPTLNRLNEVATLELWHIKAAIPIPVIHEGLVDDPEDFEEQLRNIRGPGDVLRLTAPLNVRISDVLGSTPVVQLPVEWQTVRMALITAIELITGMPGFMRGQGAPGDVATQTALSADAYNDRTNVRQAQLYQVFAENAVKTCNLFAEYMEESDSLPLRLLENSEDFHEVSRASLGFGAVGNPHADSPWDFDYDVYPYSSAEENDLVLLKRALEASTTFVGSPQLNQKRYLTWLLGLLGAPQDLLNTPEEMQAAQAALAGPVPSGATPPAVGLSPLDGINPIAADVQGGAPVLTGAQSLNSDFESPQPM